MTYLPRLALFAVPVAAALGLTPVAHAASEKGFYGALGGGGVLTEDAETEPGLGAVPGAEASFDVGFGALGAVGYDWGDLRSEFELSYRRSELDGISGFANTDGHLSNLGVMVNALYDFDTASAVTPYIGAGVGLAHLGTDNWKSGAVGLTDDSTAEFAYQGIVGLSMAITDRLDLFADYRYLASVDPTFSDVVTGGQFDTEYRTHNLFAGIRYYFNPPAPVSVAAPAPVRVAAPAPAPVKEPIPTFIVFFDWDRANIRPDAETILREAIAATQKYGVARVVLTGHADKSGAATYNMGLSQRRAANVRDWMQGNGLSDTAFDLVARGETSPLVDTADGVREPRNRRVEIVLEDTRP